jgi:hypothetical protein
MKKILKIVTVENCDECEWLDTYGDKIGFCDNTDEGRVISDTNTIPEWCPLKDYKEGE